MLPKAAQKIEYTFFKEPGEFNRPVYMWCWNSPLNCGQIKAELSRLKQENAGGVMIVPEPAYFRPETMKTTLSPDYLTCEYLQIYRETAAEAKRLGLKLWFYDEGGWPSGSACGKVTKAYPELAVKRLSQTVKPVKKGDPISGDALCLCLWAKGKKVSLKGQKTAPEDGELFCVHAVTPKSGFHPVYPDLLNAESANAFIGIGCEPYIPYIGEFTGDTVPLLFTDEPAAANPPWSDGFPKLFKEKYGYDITDRLTELFETGEESARTRIDYFDFWSALFAKRYFETMRVWCNKNGMAFAGHLGGDNGIGGLKKHGYAEPFRMYREMDIPGIDAIWRQIFPGGRKERELNFDGESDGNYHFPRWASSVAHQAGSPWTLSESFAVYGQGLTPSEMKWIVNYQLARGVTLFCFAALASGISGPYMAGERPVFNNADPMRRCLKAVNSYVSRLSYLMSLGSPQIKTALYMPVRDVWSGTPDSEKVIERYDSFAGALERQLVDFDIVDDDCLESARIAGRTLKCGAMAYETLVVPQCRQMSAAAAKKLSAFEKAGGDVRRSPEGLRASIMTEPGGLSLGVAVRSLENGRLYFIANEDTRELVFKARFPEKEPPLLLDAKTGDIRAFGCKIYENCVEAELQLPFAGSIALFFGEKGELALLPEPVIYKSFFEISAGWQFNRKKAFIIGENELESREIKENPRAAVLGPWQQYAGAEFSGEGVYTAEFICPDGAVGKNARLSLGKVEYTCRCRLNGEELGLAAWPPYEYDIGGKLIKGVNRLEVTVINTAANQYVSTGSFEKWTAAELGCYHERALVFEKRSLGGGLYGKVRVEYEDENPHM